MAWSILDGEQPFSELASAVVRLRGTILLETRHLSDLWRKVRYKAPRCARVFGPPSGFGNDRAEAE
jgi:hypothetical protein